MEKITGACFCGEVKSAIGGRILFGSKASWVVIPDCITRYEEHRPEGEAT